MLRRKPARWIASFIPSTWRRLKLEWQAVLPILTDAWGDGWHRPHGPTDPVDPPDLAGVP